MLENICLGLALSASASIVYFKQFEKTLCCRWLLVAGCRLRSSSAPQIFTTPTHTEQATTSARFPPWLICHWQEAKRMQTNNGAACVSEYCQLLGLGVGLYLARKGNPSFFLLWDRHVLCEEKLAPKEMYAAP